MSQEYAAALGQRLRAVRRQRGMTLKQVQEQSAGRWTIEVVGSYERGSRAVTVTRLAELAEFYGLSTAELLPELPAAGSPSIWTDWPICPPGWAVRWPGMPPRSSGNAALPAARC